MIASALAGRAVAVVEQRPGEPPWTDGQTIYVDPSAPSRAKLAAIAVQASMIAAGSFNPDVVRRLVRRPRLARRYLAVEGHRALVGNAELLPRALASIGDREVANRSDSPSASLSIATGRATIEEPATGFGVIRAAQVLTACSRASAQADQATPQHVPRDRSMKGQEELDDDAIDDSDDRDLFTSPVGGGGFLGTWLKKMLSSARKIGSGGGPPGADNPTHRTNSAKRGLYAVSSLGSTSSEDGNDPKAQSAADGVKYPEWDGSRKSYRPAWCTVREVGAKIKASATQEIDDAIGVRRPLSRLGMGLHRRHRQAQGDDIDIDAAVEARVELRAGLAPDEDVYLDSLRRRRDLSVLLLLDVSGSAAEPGTVGRTVHEQQRAAAAHLTVALHDLGDRVALYAYYSQGRGAVSMVPVKRFDDHLDVQVIRRLNSL
ncbi:MAG: nitric oxide reductase activation protein, partial [Mycobacterium sp.]|nr:nitric oxide reductase activation protein [Mycobacterium sp.]